MIYTSSPLVVRADTSVSECVRLMVDQNVGSILIVSDDTEESLIGIFTERDLLRKMDLIQQGDHWTHPIRTVMSSPVRTLSPSQIPIAGKLMLQGNFRHFPVVTEDKDGKQKIVGVVSMRDLFKAMVLAEEKRALQEMNSPKEDESRLRVVLISLNVHFAQFIEKIFGSVMGIKTKRTKIDENYGNRPLSVIFDIDGFEKDVWPKRLVEMNRDPLIALIIVAFDPALHSPHLLRVLEKLGRSEKFWIFRKPLEVFELLNRMTDRFQSVG